MILKETLQCSYLAQLKLYLRQMTFINKSSSVITIIKMSVVCVLISEQQALYFEIVVTVYRRLTKKTSQTFALQYVANLFYSVK